MPFPPTCFSRNRPFRPLPWFLFALRWRCSSVIGTPVLGCRRQCATTTGTRHKARLLKKIPGGATGDCGAASGIGLRPGCGCAFACPYRQEPEHHGSCFLAKTMDTISPDQYQINCFFCYFRRIASYDYVTVDCRISFWGPGAARNSAAGGSFPRLSAGLCRENPLFTFYL